MLFSLQCESQEIKSQIMFLPAGKGRILLSLRVKALGVLGTYLGYLRQVIFLRSLCR